MLDDIHLQRSHLDFSFDADGNVIGIVAHPNGHSIGIFENAVDHQFGFDFDASNFAEVGFDGFFAFVGHVEIVNFVIQIHVHRKLFSYSCGGIIQISEVIDGGSDVLGIGWNDELSLFVAEFFIVVVVNGHILMIIGIFSYGFGISQGGLRFLIHPTFKFVAHLIGPIEAFEGFAFNAKVVGVFPIDNGTLRVHRHAHDAGIYRAIVDTVFEYFAGLIGVVCHFSS